MSYANIEKIYNRERLDIFAMATTHLMSIGWNAAESITDEDIAEVEGNGLMTKEFCQMLCELAREIAQSCSPVEFIQLCQVKRLYDTKGLRKRRSA